MSLIKLKLKKVCYNNSEERFMKYLILGANAAAMSFVAKMKRNEPNNEYVVIEKRDYVSFGSCGLPYFAANYFDDSNIMIARTPNQFIEMGIDLRMKQEVVSVDHLNSTVQISSEDKVYDESYDRLIVATGASPIVYDFGTYKKDNVTCLVSMEDGKFLKEKLNNDNIKHVTIIGGGFIGLECVEAVLENKKQVTLIEKQDTILSNQFASDMLDEVHENLRTHNVKLMLNTGVSNISDFENGYEITTDNGNIKTDLIIMCLGFNPNTSFIDVDKIKNAIVVNKNYETSVKDIYAIGDCAMTYNKVLDNFTYLPLATNANKVGRNLAQILANESVDFEGMLGSSCIKVCDYELAMTGLTEKMCEMNNISYKVKIVKDKTHTNYYPNQEDISVKLIYNPDSKVIIGAQLVGKKDVVNRCNALCVAIHMKVTTSQLGYIDFCYAPPFSRTWDVLNVSGNVSK